ncbi:high mobility group box domain-containing protein, partial [Gaertneriomyces semiglobifer]
MSAAGPQYCYVPSEGTGPIVVPTPSQLGSGQYVQQHPYAAYQQQYYYPPAKPKPAAPKRIPRPANSFMTYRMEKQYQVLAENAGVNNKDISVIIGEMWRNEPEEVKEYYRKKAEIGRREHMLRYPDYKYTPLKKRKQSVTK